MRTRALIPAVAAAMALAVAGCGGDDDDETADTAATEPAPAATTPAETGGNLEDTGTKPQVAKPSGDPPANLVKEDIVEGEGAAAKSGDTVTVQYVGVSFSTGEEFDASWDRGEPFSFALGAGEVIPGWDEGVAGMKEGGRRRLVIPPDQAYGEQGAPPAIGPNETLVFVIDLLKVE